MELRVLHTLVKCTTTYYTGNYIPSPINTINSIVFITQNQSDFQNSGSDMELASYDCESGEDYRRDPMSSLLTGKREWGITVRDKAWRARVGVFDESSKHLLW